jgi:hypothetical protein
MGRKWTLISAWCLILALSIGLRCAGLFRGLDKGCYFHPDEPKQVAALSNYLQGRYVWYVGNPFYDGYPLALNHLDEWILRPVLAVGAAWQKYVGGPQTPWRPANQDRYTLTYWARGLRVLYGVLCVVLGYGVARLCGLSKRAGLGVALLMAVSPLSVTVSHTATGDVGTDVFVGLALLGLCLYVRTRLAVWLLASGMAVGAAFACKYNGALGGLAVALLIAWEGVVARSVRRLVARGAIALGGFVAGAVLMTPAFFVDAGQTWRDMRINFGFIRQYGVSKVFLAKPFAERVVLSWQWHGPRLVDAFTAAVVILAVIGAVAMLSRACRRCAPEERRIVMLRASLCLLPFLAVLISLSGKPEVQPFHFSYLQLPLAVSAVCGLDWLWSSRSPLARALAVVQLVWAVVALGVDTRRDQFFWKRTDNGEVSRDMPGALVVDAASGRERGVVRRIDLEPENPAVFRNRKHEVLVPLAGTWCALNVPPVPCTPYPEQHDWVFLNGPLFPRNDRMMKAVPGGPVAKHLVVAGRQPPAFRVGLRSGHLPTSVRVRLGGEERDVMLAPDSQTEFDVVPEHWRRGRTRGDDPQALALVALDVNTRMGPVWVTLMTDEREMARYRLFGGTGSQADASMLTRSLPHALASNLAFARFLDSGDHGGHTLDSASRERGTLVLEQDGFALPAGTYTLTFRLAGMDGEADVRINVTDAYAFDARPMLEQTHTLDPGGQIVRATFSKPLTPYECVVRLTCTRGRARLESWSLEPGYEAIIDALKAWSQGGDKPLWLAPAFAEGILPRPAVTERVVFGDCIEMVAFDAPARVRRGEPFSVHLGSVLVRPLENIEEYAWFIHLRDADGQQVYADGFELWQSLASVSQGAAVVCRDALSVPAGTYHVEVGIWNGRTKQRLSVAGDNLTRRERRKRLLCMKTPIVVED